MHDHLYLVVSGAGTARRIPALLPALANLGARLVVITTPNAARIVALRECALALEGLPGGHRVVESYFDDAILPRPPPGAVLVAPCSFDALNKLAGGIADNLALSVTAEAIGRRSPVVVAVSVNPPLWNHPRTLESVGALRRWGVEVIEPVAQGDGLTLAPNDVLLDVARRALLA